MPRVHMTEETDLSRCRQNVFTFLVLFMLILLTYSNTFHATWHFDDVPNILQRKDLHLTKLSWDQIKGTLSDRKGKLLHRPVACLSFALNYYISRENPFTYHLVNTAVHLVTAWFLFLLVRHTLRLPGIRFFFRSNAYSLALLSTVFWALNPVQTQAVTYIVQRMASLAAMFYVMAMFFYLKARTTDRRAESWLFFGLCALSALLAFGCKENSAMLPFSLLLYDVFLIQGLNKQSIRRGLLALLLLSLIPASLLLLLKGQAFFDPGHIIQSYRHRGFTIDQRLMTEARILVVYITLLLYPMPNRLCLVHDIEVSQGLLQPPTTMLSFLALALIISMALWKARKWPLVSYCVLFFFINHLIESSVFPLELFYEHRNYLPSLLFFLPISMLIMKGIHYFSYKTSMKWIFCTFIILLLTGYGHSTAVRNIIWKTEKSLWLDAIEKNPSSARAHHNLGLAFASLNNYQEAIFHYDKAIQLPRGSHGKTDHLTHHNLGNLYMKLKDDGKAVQHFMSAIELEPGFPDPYISVSILLAKNEEYDKAYNHLIRVLTLVPTNAKAHNNLGFVLLKQHRYKEALSEFYKAKDLKKDYLAALRNLGITHRYIGNIDQSIQYLSTALEMEPHSILTSFHLAESYLLKGYQYKAKYIIKKTLIHHSISQLKLQLISFFDKHTLVILPDMKRLFPVIENILQEKMKKLMKLIENLNP